MATRKQETNDQDKGADKGASKERTPALDFDEFTERLAAELASHQPAVTIAATDPEGRTIGSRLGRVQIEPLSTLEDRIAAEFPGPRLLAVRTRRVDGTWGLVARLHVPAAKAAAPPGDTQAALVKTMADVLERMERRMEKLEERGQVLPGPKVAEQVDAFDRILGAVARVAQPAAQAAPASARSALAELKDAVELMKTLPAANGAAMPLAIKALDTFKDSGNELIKSVAALIAMRVDAHYDTKDERDKAKKKAAAPKEPDEVQHADT